MAGLTALTLLHLIELECCSVTDEGMVIVATSLTVVLQLGLHGRGEVCPPHEALYTVALLGLR